MPSPAVRADHTKGDTVQAIRAAVTRLSPISLRRLREGLFKLQLQLLEDMVVSGIDVPKVQAVSHCARAIEVVDRLGAACADDRSDKPTTGAQLSGRDAALSLAARSDAQSAGA